MMGKNKQRPVAIVEGPQTQAAMQEAMGEDVEVVLKPDPIEVAAQAAHEANRAYCASIGDDSQVAWEDAPEWQKESAIKGVVFAIDNNFPSPEAMHESWMAEKVSTGWVFGEVKDADQKTHPCLVPYAALPEAQRKKDDIFSATVWQSLLEQGVLRGEPAAEAPAPADEAQLNEREGSVIYEDEWNACLTMAFKGQGRDMVTDWGNVPFVMAQFIMSNLDAPDDAVLMQVKLKEKVVILPNEDQRRVLLAVKLFSAYVLGWHAIDRADAEVLRIAEAEAEYLARKPRKLDLTDTPYELVDGPFDQTSDLAKAALARVADA
jgi:hypothetical protein